MATKKKKSECGDKSKKAFQAGMNLGKNMKSGTKKKK